MDEMNLEKSLAFYKDRFADASDFTFIFVGSFDDATMRPLVEQYLAALPSLRRKETWKNVGIDPPKGVVERRVEKGIEPKSRASIAFTGPFQYDQAQRVGDSRDGDGARDAAARDSPRGSRRHVQRRRVGQLLEDAGSRVPRVDRLRLQPRSNREPGEDRVQGDRAAEGRGSDGETGERRPRGAAPGLRDEHQAERLPARRRSPANTNTARIRRRCCSSRSSTRS